MTRWLSLSNCKLPFSSLSFSYDFDQDGLIDKEDVSLILRHIPLRNSTLEDQERVAEGLYCDADGRSTNIES